MILLEDDMDKSISWLNKSSMQDLLHSAQVRDEESIALCLNIIELHLILKLANNG